MKKAIAVVISLALLLVMVVGTTVSASTVIDVWPGDSIQAAVDAASPGDVIIVHAGVYHQSVVISTNDITLKGKKGAVLDGDSPADPDTDLTLIGILLTSGVTGVTVTGFEIRDYDAFEWPKLGIAINLHPNSHDNAIIANEITQSTFGILGSTSGGNLIERNEVHNDVWIGIGLDQHAYDNIVIKNKVATTADGIIVDEEAHGNVITKNTVSGDYYGIALGDRCHDNEIIKNKVSDSYHGIFLGDTGAHNNTVIQNKVSDSDYGISVVETSSGNLIGRNKVSDSLIFDLYWDGTGTGNTWEKNKYETSNF